MSRSDPTRHDSVSRYDPTRQDERNDPTGQDSVFRNDPTRHDLVSRNDPTRQDSVSRNDPTRKDSVISKDSVFFDGDSVTKKDSVFYDIDSIKRQDFVSHERDSVLRKESLARNDQDNTVSRKDSLTKPNKRDSISSQRSDLPKISGFDSSDIYGPTVKSRADFKRSMTDLVSEQETSAAVRRIDERNEMTEDFSEMSDIIRPSDLRDAIQSNSFVDAMAERKLIFNEFLNDSITPVILDGLKKEDLDDKAYNKIQDLIDHALNDVDPSVTNIDRAKIFRDFYDAVSLLGEQHRNPVASDESIKSVISKISGVYDQAHYENYNTEKRGPSSEKVLTVLEDFIERVVRTNSGEERLLTNSESDKALNKIKDFALEAISGSDNLRDVILFEQFLDKVFGKELLENFKNQGSEADAYNLTADLLESICDDGKKVNVVFKHPALDKGRAFEKFFNYVSQKPENLALKRKSLADPEEITEVKNKLAKLYDKTLAQSGKFSVVMESVGEKNLKFLGDFVERVLDNKRAERLFSDEMSDHGLKLIREFIVTSLEFEAIVDEVSKISSIRSSISDYRPETKIFDEFLQNIFGAQALDKLKEKGFLTKTYNLIQDLVDYSIFDVISKVKDIDPITERGLIFKNFFENVSSRSDDFMPRKRAATDECFQKALANISKTFESTSVKLQSDLQSEKVLVTLGDFVNRTLGVQDRRLSNKESDMLLSHLREYVFDCLCEKAPCSEESQTTNEDLEKIFDDFLQDIFGRDSLSKMVQGNLISTVNNKIQDLIDDAFSSYMSSDFLNTKTLEKATTFKNFISKQGSRYDTDFMRQRIATDQQVQKALTEVAIVFDKSTKLNISERASSQAGKFIKTLADYIDRKTNTVTSRLLTDDLSDEALSKITDYVLDGLSDVIPSSPTPKPASTPSGSRRPSDSITIGDNKLISFKNFDLLVPLSDKITSTTESFVEFRSSDSKGIDKSYIDLPKQYEFLNPKPNDDIILSKRTGGDKRKIVIKTTRKIPPKVCPPPGQKKACTKKRYNYSYLDDYVPSTRIYELMDYEEDTMDQATRDLFNMDCKTGYSLKPFDPAIAHSFGKPSVEQINEYLSIVNTGVDKDSDLVQIHPLLNSSSQIYYQNESDNKNVSDSYKNYFGGKF